MKYYLALLVIIVVSLLGASKLNTSSDYRVYFEQSDLTVNAKKAFDKKYALDDSLVIILGYDQPIDVSSKALTQYSLINKKLNELSLVNSIQSFSDPLHFANENILLTSDDDENEFISDENELNKQKNDELLQLNLQQR